MDAQGSGHKPLLVLNILFLQLDVPEHLSVVIKHTHAGSLLQMPLKLFQGRVFICPICAQALQRIYIRY